MKFILASSSPRRRELLSSLNVSYEIIKPDIDETQLPDEPPLIYVERLAQQKAQAVADSLPEKAETAILAADTIVVLSENTDDLADKGEILGKPATAAEAHEMLQRLRNRAHFVCTAFCLLVHGATVQQHSEVVRTRVIMRDYTDDEIEAYIATGDPFDKAGGYAIQHEGFHPVAHIEGSYSNVVGLPVDEVQAVLNAMKLQR